MKYFVVGLMIMATSSVYAADATSTAATEKESALSLDANILTGVVTTTEFADGSTDGLVGPFIRPTLGVSYSQDKFNLGLSYVLETMSRAGFADNSGSMGQNTYFMHEPTISASATLNDKITMNILGDFLWHYYTGAQSQNLSEVYFRPDLTYNINDNNSVAMAYVLYRTDAFDSANLGLRRNDAGETRFATNAEGLSAGSVSTLHAAQATVANTLSDSLKLKTYFRTGREFTGQSNDPNDNYQYRLQSQLKATLTDNLSGDITYRFNYKDADDKNSYYNRVYLNAGYELSSNWSIQTENTFNVSQDTAPGSSATTIFENYTGVQYTF